LSDIEAFVGPNVRSNLPLMASEDLATNIAATRAFLHGYLYQSMRLDPTVPLPAL
jgi:hypothetical protein